MFCRKYASETNTNPEKQGKLELEEFRGWFFQNKISEFFLKNK